MHNPGAFESVPGNAVLPIAYPSQSSRGTRSAMVLSSANDRWCGRCDGLEGPQSYNIASFEFWCFRWQVGDRAIVGGGQGTACSCKHAGMHDADTVS